MYNETFTSGAAGPLTADHGCMIKRASHGRAEQQEKVVLFFPPAVETFDGMLDRD